MPPSFMLLCPVKVATIGKHMQGGGWKFIMVSKLQIFQNEVMYREQVQKHSPLEHILILL